MTDFIRFYNNQQEGKDNDIQNMTIIGEDGYQWHFGPNERKVLPIDIVHTCAANATSATGDATQQTYAPTILADDDDLTARS